MPRPTPDLQREYQRNWRNERRAKYLAGATCARCGCAANDEFDLDHIDPSTKVDHKIWSWRKERLEAEFAKCQWLCRPCHVDKTKEDRLTDHGTRGRYDRGCRCDECTLWSRANARAKRAARPLSPEQKQRARERASASYHRRSQTPEQRQALSDKATERYWRKKLAG